VPIFGLLILNREKASHPFSSPIPSQLTLASSTRDADAKKTRVVRAVRSALKVLSAGPHRHRKARPCLSTRVS